MSSLAVVRDGRLVKAQGYGLANLELKVPVRPQTAFEIGSVGKQFTSAAVLLLVEEGTLSLKASVHEFFPQAPPSWRGITIRHLLQHTSGIQNHVAVPGYIGVFKTNLLFEAFPPREELLDLFFKLPLEFRPGDRILDQLALDIAGMYAPALRRPEGNDPDPSRTERHKAVIAGLLEGKHEDAAFTNAMATFLRTATGKGFWQWTAAHGTLDSLVFSGIDEVGELRVVRYRAVLGGSPYWISVRLVAGGRIAQITWW